MEFRTTIISPDQPASALIGCERTDMTLYSQFKRSRVIPIYIQQDATLHSLFYLGTALHVSSGNTTHQERKQLYLQHLVFVTL